MMLKFEERKMLAADLGEASCVPNLVGHVNLQQGNTVFELEETDEIYEGYGLYPNSYPYRQQDGYTGKLREKKVKTAVLENQHLRAEFLTEFGGRLWSLVDKRTGRNLLYTNDVIQFRNLAVCNAWFSGGVEWNIGIIGHSPFTARPLYVAELEYQGRPVLRMYEYERIRGVVYQMDFWLEEDSRFLNCRMRVVNSGADVVPMYWWSNIAAPEYEGGRIIVPSGRAYTSGKGKVYKVDIPVVAGVDVTRYQNIPGAVDYFFELDSKMPAYIANVDRNGYGLLHLSTKRLQSRKLFSWGNNEGSDRWQEFLTKDGGRYIEIQAGLGKTQYGCIPMAPHTAWEWLEQYGALELREDELLLEYGRIVEAVAGRLGHKAGGVEEHAVKARYREIEAELARTEQMAKTRGRLVWAGSVFGGRRKERKGTEHLEFIDWDEGKEGWGRFLETGILPEKNPDTIPEEFVTGEDYFRMLKKAVRMENKENWYAHYQLGLLEYQKSWYDDARREFLESLRLEKNAWAYHGLACVELQAGEKEEAASWIQKGMALRGNDVSYLKEGFRLLELCGADAVILTWYERLAEGQKKESRLRFFYVKALHKVGRSKEAFEALNENGGWVPDDFREGEVSVGKLWGEIQKSITGLELPVPHVFCFSPGVPDGASD